MEKIETLEQELQLRGGDGLVAASAPVQAPLASSASASSAPVASKPDPPPPPPPAPINRSVNDTRQRVLKTEDVGEFARGVGTGLGWIPRPDWHCRNGNIPPEIFKDQRKCNPAEEDKLGFVLRDGQTEEQKEKADNVRTYYSQKRIQNGQTVVSAHHKAISEKQKSTTSKNTYYFDVKNSHLIPFSGHYDKRNEESEAKQCFQTLFLPGIPHILLQIYNKEGKAEWDSRYDVPFYLDSQRAEALSLPDVFVNPFAKGSILNVLFGDARGACFSLNYNKRTKALTVVKKAMLKRDNTYVFTSKAGGTEVKANPRANRVHYTLFHRYPAKDEEVDHIAW